MAQTLEEILQVELGNLVFQLCAKEHQLQVANEKVAEQAAELIKWRPDPKPTFSKG